MQEIADGVLIETGYPGVTLGAVTFKHGLVLIDAPPRTDDARAWRSALLTLGGGVERLLINLDFHTDRTLGARAMECPVVAHDKTAEVFRSRSNTFKAQDGETGAEYEQMGALGSVRWAPPDLTFTHCLTLHWGDSPLVLEHHPGPNPGAIWVILPAEQVAFVGDLVTPNQPPFLANADLNAWISGLELLLTPTYAGFLLVSGRGSIVTTSDVRAQVDLLSTIRARTDALAGKSATGEAPGEALEALVPELLAVLKPPAARREQYAQRLRWGLARFYAHRILPAAPDESIDPTAN